VQNDPVNLVDPSGLDGGADFAALLLGAQVGASFSVHGGGSGGFLGGGGGGSGKHDMVMELAIDNNGGDGGGGESPNTAPSLPDAIKLAKQLLADPKGPCAGLFKKGNGLSTLNGLEKKNKIKIADTKVKLFGGTERLLSTMPGVGAVITSKGIFINPVGRIALGNPSPAGPFGKLTPLEGMAATIIHEDAHKTGDFPYEARPEDSIFHNADVVDACFGGRRP
jgi:hypothetical protein